MGQDAAGLNLPRIDFHKGRGAAIEAAAARIDDPQAVLLPVAVRLVGVAIESGLRIHGPGLPGQIPKKLLDMVLMAMGQIEPDAADGWGQDLRLPRIPAIPVTVAWDLVEGNAGVLLVQSSSIVGIVPQVNEYIGLDCLHAVQHKAQGAVRIR